MTRDDGDGSASTKNFGGLNPAGLQTTVSPPPAIAPEQGVRVDASVGRWSRPATSSASAGRSGGKGSSDRPGASPGWSDAADRTAEPSGAGKAQPGAKTAARGKGAPAARREYGPRDTMPDGPRGLSTDFPPAAAAVLPGKAEGHKTVMMQPLEAQAAREVGEPRMLSIADPPEINLTQHAVPSEQRLDDRLVLVARPDSTRASSFRVLRHHIMENGRPQVIVVSSPNPREGKTTVAVNLALALAECSRARVLLVEASLRRPQLAVIFRFEPPWCFAEQLTAHRHQPLLPWGFVNIPQMCLHVAAIDPRIDQRQLLDAPAFAIAMERLRLAKYDHIVIDAPAVLGSAEVNLMQDAADGVLLTAATRATTARDLRQAVYQLTPTKLLGTVLVEQ